MSEMTAELVRRLLTYDAETGLFHWIASPSMNVPAGRIAGRLDHRGYYAINIRGRKYASHRLAWLHAYGAWPNKHIDHINRNPSDNRLANLRDVSASENCRNRRSPASPGRRPGTKGVSYHKHLGKWQAQICIPVRKIKYLGVFTTEAEAAAAYAKAVAEANL